MSGLRTFSRVLAVAIALLAHLASAETPVPSVERSFVLLNRPVDDAYRLVAPLLSPLAEVRVARAESRLTVRDEAAIVARVAEAIVAFDVARRMVQVSVRVVRGERREVPDTGLASAHDAGIPPNVGKLLRYNTYDIVGEVDLAIEEEGSGSALLGRDGALRVDARLGRVSPGDGVIALEQLSLSQRVGGAPIAGDRAATSAAGATDAFRTLIAWSEELHEGRSRVLFATPGANDRRALFVIVQARLARP